MKEDKRDGKVKVEKCDHLEEYRYSTGKHGNEVDEKESTW